MREAEAEAVRDTEPTQEPHTKMWGIKIAMYITNLSNTKHIYNINSRYIYI